MLQHLPGHAAVDASYYAKASSSITEPDPKDRRLGLLALKATVNGPAGAQIC